MAGVTAATIARVLVVSPLPQLDRLFDYRVPEAMGDVAPGVRVKVPLRSAGRIADGYVVELAHQVDYPGPLSDVEELVSPVPVLRPEVWALARAVSTRAAGSASDILRLAIPPRQVRVEKSHLAASAAPVDSARETTPVPPASEDLPPGALEALLEARGRAALQPRPGVVELAAGPEAGRWVGRWARLLATAAAASLARGGSAILVVPDYRDQEQLVHALSDLVDPGDVVRWDARQPNPDRARGLLRAAGERPAVVVGTRSAIYAPAASLGLIAVWDDGDPLHQEPLAPYVHARDAALVRQEQQGAALLLASHTRSTETQRLVELGWLEELRPARAPHPRVIPTADVLGRERLAEQARIPSTAWRHAAEAVARGPVLVQVGRPGFAPGLVCGDCSAPARCRRCGGPLRLPRRNAPPTCLWCGVADPNWRCAECRGGRLRSRGSGSQRTAEELGRAFPRARVIVADGERTVTEVPDKPALVIATRGAEPIAAGGYRAVLLLDGERMVARESLRVAEDCLRWWSSAAALAADGAPIVLVGVGGGLAQALATWTQPAFARAELEDRRVLRFPPAVRVATLTGHQAAVESALARVAGEGVDVLGPTGEGEEVRAIVRFDYAAGARVAGELRAEVVRLAGARRKPPPGGARRGRQPVPLRVRIDDPEPFEE
ncbi:primosomal protein N' [Homoserinibacter sp. YIM 151385]|uniref:primosomal protein N' family DNA-binding protein n=1 Tax=Homoserinibacter sp. YIM 151385 TaxID=2985506 RepID=UPI0022F078D0|nr:primosomal protein N' [Homoserinibacter sp. YIM 151385]WBU38648.1 primosomal protein N' [Homoserinibacter sp. YIM 151385]